MIKGVEILNKTPITEMTNGGFIVLIISAIVMAIAIFSIDNCNSRGQLIWFLISLISVISIIVGLNIRKPTGRYEYKVTIDNDVPIQEVYENYKIVEKDGKIWILEDKE